MGHKKVFARQEERRKNRITRIAKSLMGNLAYVFLGAAVIFFAVVVAAVARRAPVSTTQAGSSAAATANAGSGWVTLSSNSPAAIIAAARKTTLFNVNRSGNGDYLKDLSHLETPVLVHALQMPGAVVMPDYYVIPIDDASGKMVGAAELALNPTHTAVQMSAIITYTHPHQHGQLARVGITTALAALSNERRVALRSGAQPQLVYMPVDAAAQQSGAIVWYGGGEYPADPMWLIPGADGQNHVVGADGHAYDMSALPIMKQP